MDNLWIWLVVEPPLWKKYESQFGWSFPIGGKIKHVPNHQPDINRFSSTIIGSIVLWDNDGKSIAAKLNHPAKNANHCGIDEDFRYWLLYKAPDILWNLMKLTIWTNWCQLHMFSQNSWFPLLNSRLFFESTPHLFVHNHHLHDWKYSFFLLNSITDSLKSSSNPPYICLAGHQIPIHLPSGQRLHNYGKIHQL